jgi:hypothetical protein
MKIQKKDNDPLIIIMTLGCWIGILLFLCDQLILNVLGGIIIFLSLMMGFCLLNYDYERRN